MTPTTVSAPVRSGEWHELDLEWRQVYFKGLPWKALGHALLVLSPVLVFLLWRVSYYGLAFSKVEEEYFGRGLLAFGNAFIAWLEALRRMLSDNSQATACYLVEFGGIVLGRGRPSPPCRPRPLPAFLRL